MIKRFRVILVLLALIGSSHADIVEGFDPGGGSYLDITGSLQTSVDTGYGWRGYHGGALWNMCLYDAKHLPIADGVLDMSGNNAPSGFDNLNAWAIFSGDYIQDLIAVRFEWHSEGTSGNLLAEALIQDAAGDWFVSDDTVVDTASTIQTIDATTTTWRQLNTAPALNTALDIGAAGTPDLSAVSGGGFHTIGTGQASSQTRLDSLTFVGTTQQSQEIDPNNPPASMRVMVDKSGQTRTFNLDKYSVRGPDFELVLIDPIDPNIMTTIDPGPVRHYRGWCEEEPDSYVDATLLPNGDLRYMVFKGHYVEDWAYYPALVYDENADPENNFTPVAGTPVQPSGTKMVGASWTDPAVALAELWETYGAGMGNFWKTTYQADVGFDLLVEYVDAFNYSDWVTYGRKAENALSHYNGSYIRDTLMEMQLGKVVIRQSRAGLHYTHPQWGVQWPSINHYWNLMFPDVDHQFVGMIGAVGGGVAFGCEYAGLGWAARSYSGWSGGGDFWHVARHEMGHNNGAGDNMGPEWGTIMSGNSTGLNGFSTYEVNAFLGCRAGRYTVLRDLGEYSYPLPPHAKYDDGGTICVDGYFAFDVLGNDYDANVDQLAIESFDTETTLGGTVDFSAGSGPDGRDELFYLPPETAGIDTFTYRIVDATGRTAQGNIVITVTEEFLLSPEGDITFSGLIEGPAYNVTSSTDTLTLDNVSSLSLDWTASKTQSWLTLSSTGGTITSGGSDEVTITITAAADSLPAGDYTDTVTITDTTNSIVFERDITLTIVRDVVEDFGGTYTDIRYTPGVSASTGYTWSGYHYGWGMGLITSDVGMLDMSGVDIGYGGWNAWTEFNGSHIADLISISFKWDASSVSGNLNARAVIKDANGDWFVSDDAVPSIAGETFSINATTATWKILNSDPVINTPLDIGSASMPDLTEIYGGGFLADGLATGGQTRLDSLTFSYYDSDPPTPNPAGFASTPTALTDSDITMTATTGTDYHDPVEYYFAETSGNSGGTDSGWVTDPVYIDTGLEPGVEYSYTVQMRDAVTPTPNVGSASSPASATTFEYAAINEDFEYASDGLVNFWGGSLVSASTGYTWSATGGGWGVYIWEDSATNLDSLALNSYGFGVVGSAWATFDGDSVTNLASIRVMMDPVSTHEGIAFRVFIQDASGDWFCASDQQSPAGGGDLIIDTTTTTWNTITTPYVGYIYTETGTGTPDLSNVTGGGIYYWGWASTNALFDSIEFFGALSGDFEPDGDVDLMDLSYLTQRWLLTGCASPDWCQGADLDHLGGTVNLADFAIFAENWLK